MSQNFLCSAFYTRLILLEACSKNPSLLAWSTQFFCSFLLGFSWCRKEHNYSCPPSLPCSVSNTLSGLNIGHGIEFLAPNQLFPTSPFSLSSPLLFSLPTSNVFIHSNCENVGGNLTFQPGWSQKNVECLTVRFLFKLLDPCSFYIEKHESIFTDHIKLLTS